jgi:hypothetical protein
MRYVIAVLLVFLLLLGCAAQKTDTTPESAKPSTGTPVKGGTGSISTENKSVAVNESDLYSDDIDKGISDLEAMENLTE